MYKYPFHIDVFFLWKMHGQDNEANTMSPYIYKKIECNESGIPVCQKLTANMVL
jgi:hypothetical protein